MIQEPDVFEVAPERPQSQNIKTAYQQLNTVNPRYVKFEVHQNY